MTRTDAVNAGTLNFKAAFVGTVEDDLDLVNVNGEAKYYTDSSHTQTVNVSDPNKQGNFTITVTASLAGADGVELADALAAFFSDHTLTVDIYVDEYVTTGLQCKVVAAANTELTGAGAFAATNGNHASPLSITAANSFTEGVYTTYIAYWCLENGTSDSTSSAVGGTLGVDLTIV